MENGLESQRASLARPKFSLGIASWTGRSEIALVYGLETLPREGFDAGACLNPLIGEVKGDDVDPRIMRPSTSKILGTAMKVG